MKDQTEGTNSTNNKASSESNSMQNESTQQQTKGIEFTNSESNSDVNSTPNKSTQTESKEQSESTKNEANLDSRHSRNSLRPNWIFS
ncbi:hypothetical protein Hanom_Chr05g00432801 [Helianthus anomalus]